MQFCLGEAAGARIFRDWQGSPAAEQGTHNVFTLWPAPPWHPLLFRHIPQRFPIRSTGLKIRIISIRGTSLPAHDTLGVFKK